MTELQLRFLTYIRDHIGTHGIAPSYADMQRDLGASSRGHAHTVVQRLIDTGHLVRAKGGRRNLRLPGIDLSAVPTPALTKELERRHG